MPHETAAVSARSVYIVQPRTMSVHACTYVMFGRILDPGPYKLVIYPRSPCVRACVRAYVRVCVCACVRTYARARARWLKFILTVFVLDLVLGYVF